MHFEGLRLRCKAQGARLLNQQAGHAFVFQFDRHVAMVTDQKWHRVMAAWLVATYEGIDRFQLVNEAIVEQEVQSPINRGRCDRTTLIAHHVEQGVCLQRLARRSDEAQDALAQRGQTQTTLDTNPTDLSYILGGLVDVVLGVIAGLRRDSRLHAFDHSIAGGAPLIVPTLSRQADPA